MQDALELYLRNVAAHQPPRNRLGYVMAIMRNAFYSEHRRARWRHPVEQNATGPSLRSLAEGPAVPSWDNRVTANGPYPNR